MYSSGGRKITSTSSGSNLSARQGGMKAEAQAADDEQLTGYAMRMRRATVTTSSTATENSRPASTSSVWAPDAAI